MNQYEIWLATLPAPAGRRPVLLLSRDSAYAYLNKFLVAEITTTRREIPVEVPLGRGEVYALGWEELIESGPQPVVD